MRLPRSRLCPSAALRQTRVVTRLTEKVELVTGGGYIPVKSVTFSTSSLPLVGNKLHLDVFIPRPQREYYWVGDVRVELSCPAQGINETVSNEQKSLTHLFEDEFNSLTFTLKPNIKTALQTPGRNCTIRPVLNITYGPPSGVFYFDNMGFIQ